MRARRDDAGQAMAEYGIMLALTAGLAWLERLVGVIGERPLLALVGALILVALGLAVMSGGEGRR